MVGTGFGYRVLITLDRPYRLHLLDPFPLLWLLDSETSTYSYCLHTFDPFSCAISFPEFVFLCFFPCILASFLFLVSASKSFYQINSVVLFHICFDIYFWTSLLSLLWNFWYATCSDDEYETYQGSRENLSTRPQK